MSKLPEIHGSVLWLTPDQHGALFFRKWIKLLSRRYNTPEFAPHITLARVTGQRPEVLKPALKHFAEIIPPFELECQSVECRDHPYQKLVVQIKLSRVLDELFKTTDHILGGPFSKKHDPHLSLLYGHQSCRCLKKILAEIKPGLPVTVQIQYISFISLEGTPETWNTLYTVPLQHPVDKP